MIDGKCFNLKVNRNHKIGSLKFMIFQQRNIPILQQSLILAGKKLQDQRLVKDYEIEPLTTIHLVVVKGNGCFRPNT